MWLVVVGRWSLAVGCWGGWLAHTELTRVARAASVVNCICLQRVRDRNIETIPNCLELWLVACTSRWAPSVHPRKCSPDPLELSEQIWISHRVCFHRVTQSSWFARRFHRFLLPASCFNIRFRFLFSAVIATIFVVIVVGPGVVVRPSRLAAGIGIGVVKTRRWIPEAPFL